MTGIDSEPAHLPQVDAFSWWTRGSDVVFTTQVPIKPDGSFELGATGDQMAQVFNNLDLTLSEADLGRADIRQVIVYLTRMTDLEEVNVSWSTYFGSVRPNRAIIGASELAVPGMTVEAVVYASGRSS